jgi:predicted NACHT family NTPase
MDRIVRQIRPIPSKDDADQTGPFSSFSDKANIVLLGDPGAGKSHTFEHLPGRFWLRDSAVHTRKAHFFRLSLG